MEAAAAKTKGNPRNWQAIKAPHIPVMGYEYRAVSDGSIVLIQKKAWKNPFPFRTKVRMTTEAWRHFEATITGKTDAEAARMLARLVKP